MSAFAVAERTADAAPDASARSGGLSACLFAAAQAGPQRTALRDSGDRTAWCGRPTITWTYAAAAEIVGRLARGISAWRLPAGSRVGLWYSGGAESALAHLAVEAAGHLPCPMPALWDAEQLSAGIAAAGLVAVLTEGRRGARRPAEDLACAAMGLFGLRYLAAFGPGVPDGVISLDAIALERGIVAPGASRGLVTFAAGDPGRPVYRSAASLAAAIDAHLAPLPVTVDERILTLLPAHDLRGLVTGLGAALTVGASLETVIPFDEAGFRAALLRPVPTRLVVPALIETALTVLPLPWTVRAVEVVRRATAGLTLGTAPEAAGPRRLDSLVFGEDAVLTRRGPRDLAETLAETFAETSGAALADPERTNLPGAGLEVALIDLGGNPDVFPADSESPPRGLAYRGLACATAPLPRGGVPDPDAQAWRDSGYRPILSGGIVTGIAAA